MHQSEIRESFLSLHEIENYVESLCSLSMEDIGTLKWFNQHEILEKLNMQALVEARIQAEESVQEKFIFFDKMYSMVTIASLLESLTFRSTFCENLDERATDLVDVCHANIVKMITGRSDKHFQQQKSRISKKSDTPDDAHHQLLQQRLDIEMILSAKSLGILCHLIQHAPSITLSAVCRICDHHDVPVFLADLIERNPWKIMDGDQMHKFIDGEWKPIAPDDRICLTQTEGQMWMALHQCILGSEFRGKYYLNEHRKNRLLKVRPLLTEVLLDQIPGLVDVQRCLDMLVFMETPMPKKGLIIEQAPVVREALFSAYKDRWDHLAQCHVNVTCNDHRLLKMVAARMSEIYSTESMDPILPEPAKCAWCGYAASRKCSSCKAEWYCRRECQVKHWSKHKEACKLLTQPLYTNSAQ
ncbi:zinc finger MYND domain-containing protein 10-like isoform X2 [Paramacrobiotus metropolitanus]|uniref:zinc finger MYND domain-containing protein 10-like isoform X2 n=1 Tax=Paramacrobiotus metropolitanus TaxID=2943436 RepID=UPI002445EC45|nr:zinc finger MYND domain-containing protein 10-like isoform X2 [Paramacrobiotus metropolitanus]